MRKLICCVTIACLCVGGAWALSRTQLERAVLQAQYAASWANVFVLMQTQFKRVSRSYVPDRFPRQSSDVLPYREQQRYMQRLLDIQKLVSKHPLLYRYRFVSPTPADLLNLQPERVETIKHFLQSTINLPNPQANTWQRVRPFTLALHLGGTQSTVEIWIDVPTEKIYLMSNNLYSTAEARYNLLPH